MIRLFLTVTGIGDVMDAGFTHVRVYTDTSATGTFATLDGTATLVAGQESYEYVDLEGTSATWYRTCYYSVANGNGDLTAARRGDSRAAYGTVLELRNRVDVTERRTDVELAGLLDAATRAIDRLCNRPDGFMADITASARIYNGSGTAVQWIDECVEITQVSVKDSATDSTYTAWNSGDWIAFSGNPEDPDFNSTPYRGIMIDPTGDEASFTSGQFTWRRGFRPQSGIRRRGVPTVEVTARFGYSDTVPADIREACLMQATRWLKRFQSAMSDTAGSADFGTLLYRQTLDPDVKSLLINGRYKRPAIGRY